MILSKALFALVLLTCVSVAFEIPLSVRAQQIDLSVSPPKLELLIKPDTQLSIPYIITNRGDSASINLLVNTFSVAKQQEFVSYGSVEKLPMKISFADENLETVESFTVNKGAYKKIFLQLDVSDKAIEGDYQLSLIIETQPDFLDKQFSSRIKSQIASPLLITVTKTGRTQARGAISIFEIAGNLFDSFDSIPVKLRVKNKGKNAMSVGGELTIRGSFGESATYPLQSKNILTGSDELMKTTLAKDDSTLTLKGFFMGRYGVSTSVKLADGTVQLSKSTSFLAFPFKIMAIAAATSFIGIMLLRRKR